jgi:predicted DNA-binding protein
MKNQILNIRVSEDLKNDLEFISEMKSESVSDLSRKAIEKYVQEYTDKEDYKLQEVECKNNEDIDSFNFAHFVCSIQNKGSDLKEKDNKYIYAQLQLLVCQINNTPYVKEKLYDEFKKAKSDLELLMMFLNFYFNDIFKSEDPEVSIEYYDFKEYLFNLKKGVDEYEEVILYTKAPNDVD